MGTNRTEQLKRRTRAQLVLRFAGRLTAAVLALLISTLVGVQFARAIGENVAMAGDLSSVQGDIVSLKKRLAAQRRELARLQDPQGAIPEIHDRLRLVRPNEVIIFVSPAPGGTP
jgi:cell division protein FtsB